MDFFPPEHYWHPMAGRRIGLPAGRMHPSFEAFNKYLDAYQAAHFAALQQKKLFNKVVILKARIAIMKSRMDEVDNNKDSAQNMDCVKRKRRVAEDIDRSFVCEFERCHKVYGTLGSLQQHYRLKHCIVPPGVSPSTNSKEQA